MNYSFSFYWAGEYGKKRQKLDKIYPIKERNKQTVQTLRFLVRTKNLVLNLSLFYTNHSLCSAWAGECDRRQQS